MTIKPHNLPYRKCVGIMVLNSDNKVWVGHRIAETTNQDASAAKLWQMPQGGIDKGEEPEQAARRELYEETGMQSVDLLAEAPDWINYDLPKHLIGIALKGKYRGQSQRWFAYRFNGDEKEIQINPPPSNEKAEFDQWDWAEMNVLPDLIVPFKRELYLEVVEAFNHLAEGA